MNIQSVRISGFRCYGPVPVLFTLAGAVTAFVGANGSGKTALLQALVKLFGVSRTDRTVTRGDFHVPPSEAPGRRSPRFLFIDVIVGLPELSNGTATPDTVAPAYKYMLITKPGGTPVCRMRLEARWEDDGTVDGEVTQRLDWIGTLDAEILDEQRFPVSASARGLIQLYYTPASRDATAQVRASTGALAARLLRAIDWSQATRSAIASATAEMRTSFSAETGISNLSSALAERWAFLNADSIDADPAFVLGSPTFEQATRNIAVVFQQSAYGMERDLNTLSDGQQSLFYFALAAAVFDVEHTTTRQQPSGFVSSALTPPALSIFAIEEPENHLAPFYLSRIIEQIRSITAGNSAQAIFTSHSPSVLSRVDPQEVRYCRRDLNTGLSSVQTITLPENDEDAAKFIRGAMLAYPELYFARFVVLGEGDSEQIILPRLARSMRFMIDTSFVAVVPLGGRHVSHFWRLLSDLRIPHATLLDLDVGRKGGGYGRIKNAFEELIKLGADPAYLLRTQGDQVKASALLSQMHTWNDEQYLDGWIQSLRPFGVYFAAPLDLDLAMLHAFPEAYASLIPQGGGPELSVEEAAIAALSKDGLHSYHGKYHDYAHLLPAYRYHFLTHSKPATHLRALANISDAALFSKMPPALRELLEYVRKCLNPA